MAGSQRAPHIVLNCANIGCAFGGNQEQHGKNAGKFDWSGVEHAFNFYNQKGYIIHAIIGQRLLHKAGRDRISAQFLGLQIGIWRFAGCQRFRFF